MATALSDFSKSIKIVSELSRVHQHPIQGIVERRLTPAETVTALYYSNDGHVVGLTQETVDCLNYRYGIGRAIIPARYSRVLNHNETNTNETAGYEPNRNSNTNSSTRRKGDYNYTSAIKIPALKKHSLFQSYPELLSYRGGPLPLYLYSLDTESAVRWISPHEARQMRLSSGATWNAPGANVFLNEENINYNVEYDTYRLYIAFVPLWTGEVYVYMYSTMHIPEHYLTNLMRDAQTAITHCFRPAALPVLENIPRGARQMERLGIRRAFGRLPAEVINRMLAMRGPGEHLARCRKTRRRK